jgi:hypothetical protein
MRHILEFLSNPEMVKLAEELLSQYNSVSGTLPLDQKITKPVANGLVPITPTPPPVTTTPPPVKPKVTLPYRSYTGGAGGGGSVGVNKSITGG